jgi:hypothetical protein
MDREMIVKRALELWQEREMEFPLRVRRMMPDRLDYANGAWDRVLQQAYDNLSSKQEPLGAEFEDVLYGNFFDLYAR